MTIANTSALGVSQDELVEAVLCNPHTYALAEARPPVERYLGGRPRTYDPSLFFIYACLADIYKSARQATTNLRGPRMWKWLREGFADAPTSAERALLPAVPPTHTWYPQELRRLFQRQNRDGVDYVERLRVALMHTGVQTAVEVGFPIDRADLPFDPFDIERRIEADGKVIRPITKAVPGDTREVEMTDPYSGWKFKELREVRSCSGSKEHRIGDGSQVHGAKFWHMTIHGSGPYRRVFLGVDYVPGIRGEHDSEGDIEMKNFRLIAPLAPGIVGVTTDTVTRGVHLDEIQEILGWAPIVPVTAGPADRQTGERTEKNGQLGRLSASDLGCDVGGVDLWYEGGWLCRAIGTVDGVVVLDRCDYVGPIREIALDGTFEFYAEYVVTCLCSSHSVTVREPTWTRGADHATGFNRGENVRLVPQGSEPYVRLYPRRSDAEGSNRRINDHLYLGRSRSYDVERQLLDLIAHAHVMNSLARHRWGSRRG